MGHIYRQFRCTRLPELNDGPAAALDRHVAVTFGEYEVDSPAEWALLVSSLTVMQLAGLKRMVGKLKECSEAVRCESVLRKATAIEHRVADLMARLALSLERLRSSTLD